MPAILPQLIHAVSAIIRDNAEEVTLLDQAIGDGDHVINLQRGLAALSEQAEELATQDWPTALQKIGMSLLSTVGGASGSLYGTLFLSMSKALRGQDVNPTTLAATFAQGVEAMKQRGKADLGEKTMLDVLIPVASTLQDANSQGLTVAATVQQINDTALAGLESTRDLLATKGRAAFLGERAKGHLDAGARTSQLMLAAIGEVLTANG